MVGRHAFGPMLAGRVPAGPLARARARGEHGGMVRPLLVGLAPALVLLASCRGSPDPTPLDSPAGDVKHGPGDVEASGEPTDDDGAAADRRAREAARRELARLLPLDERVVSWFEVRRADRERARRVAALTMLRGNRAGAPRFLETIGLTGAAEPTLRLWRGDDEVWVLPAGALGPEVGHAPYRALTADAAWDDGPEGRGRRGPVEVVSTPLGQLRALRVDHARSGDVLVRHVFAPDHGLVGLEVVVRRESRLRLDLVEVSPRGAPPDGYDASTPSALWQSVGEALRRADVDGLSRLMSPALRRRERTSAWERVRDLAPVPTDRAAGESPSERVRAELGELLELDVRVHGAWTVDGDAAVASASVTVPLERGDGPPRTVRGEVVLRWRADGAWRWEDLRVP